MRSFKDGLAAGSLCLLLSVAVPIYPANAQASGSPSSDILKTLQGLAVKEAPAQPQKDVGSVNGTMEQMNLQDAQPPSQSGLQSPVSNQGQNSLPASDDADDLFYDANQLATKPPQQGTQQAKKSPVKVNPSLNPASRLIVVTKDHGKNSVKARATSAERAISLGRYDSALKIYDELYEKDPKNIGVLMGRAVALQKLERDEEAIRAYENVMKLDPKNVEAQLNMLGLLGQRYPAVALRKLMLLNKENPDNIGIVAQIAVVQAESGRYDKAIEYLGMASGMEPKNPNHVFNMAVIADRAGEKDQAIEYYEKALQIDSVFNGSRLLPRDVIFERLAELR